MPDLPDLLDLIERSLERPDIRGPELAAAAHLSRFHFDRIASAALGETPGAFRRRLLLERAAIELATSEAPVIEIAQRAGYASPDAFTRAFARGFGRTPSGFRTDPTHGWRLPAPSGIHFHPPGGLRLPPVTRSSPMDVLTRMYDHHIDTTAAIIDRLDRVGDALDVPIESSVEGIDEHPTLRLVVDRLVRQLEMWVTAIDGGTAIDRGPDDPNALRRRLEAAAPRFRALVVDRIADGDGDETFVDATCTPPRTFTPSGVLAHVLTFSAVRRTLAIGALETAGIDDLGSGDPMRFVGGEGEDAARITRNFA